MALTNAEKQKRWRERRNALAANEALRNRAVNATQYYPHLSQWPTSAPAPTHDLLAQAYALLRAARPRARPEASHKALGVAAYLSGHYWWPDDLARAIDRAMGKQNGAANDPRNVITERRTGLERLGLVTLDRRSDGRRQTWSCKLTAKGEAVVAAYCAAQGIENPIAAARERQAKATARAHEQDQPSLLPPTNEEVAVSDAATGQRIESDIAEIERRHDLKPTEKEALIQARRGQGKFRQDLREYWGGCAVVGCTAESVLRASHIKPWKKSCDAERLDGANGLLLSANLDALFNDGLITFEDNGQMLVSDYLSQENRVVLQLQGNLRKTPTPRQQTYLRFHRANVFRENRPEI